MHHLVLLFQLLVLQRVVFYDQFQDYLPGFTTTGAAGAMVVRHSFGNNGNITQDVDNANCPW